MKKQLEFKIISAGIFDSRYAFGNENGFITKERCLSNYELELFAENGGKTFINGESYEISKGKVLVGKPGQKRHSKLHFKAYYVHIEINDCYLKHCIDELPDFFEAQNNRVYEEIFLRITELNESDFAGKELCTAAKIYNLVSEMYKDANKTKIQMGQINEKNLKAQESLLRKITMFH